MNAGSEMLTTGQVAQLLGCSRQHVVNMCDSGRLPYATIGSHRRIPRREVQALLEGGRRLRREEERSLWLHRALLAPLLRDPDKVLDHARSNIARWSHAHRPGGMSRYWMKQWESVIAQGVDEVADVLVSRDQRAVELRANSPFAGVLDEQERLALHQSFRRHWAAGHPAA